MRRLLIVLVLAAACGSASGREGAQLALVEEGLFVGGYLEGCVYRVRPSTGEVLERAVTPRQNNRHMAWNPRRKELYVAAENGLSLCVLEVGPLRQVATIREGVGTNAWSIAVSPDGARLYAIFTNASHEPDGPSDCRLAVFDLETRRLAKSVALADRFERASLALSRDGSQVYVSRERAFEVYDATSLERVRRVETTAPAYRVLASSPDGRWLYGATSFRGSGTAARVDATTLETAAAVEPAFTLARSRDGARVWVASGTDVVECDAALEPLRRLELPESPIDLEPSLDGRRLYALTWTHNSVALYVVDLASGGVKGPVPLPKDARGLCVAPVPVKGPR